MNKFESETLASGKSVESADSMLRRFKKRVIEEGVLDEFRRRQYYMSKSEKRKEKSKRARILAMKSSKKQNKQDN